MPRPDTELLIRFERINRLYFQGQYRLKSLAWSSQPFTGIYRGYDCAGCWAFFTPTHRIYLNVCLKGKCPLYVLDYLIYHECLHLYWNRHCQSFMAEEQKFKHYLKADQWLKKHEQLKKATC